jgi:hypothetical protein
LAALVDVASRNNGEHSRAPIIEARDYPSFLIIRESESAYNSDALANTSVHTLTFPLQAPSSINNTIAHSAKRNANVLDNVESQVTAEPMQVQGSLLC